MFKVLRVVTGGPEAALRRFLRSTSFSLPPISFDIINTRGFCSFILPVATWLLLFRDYRSHHKESCKFSMRDEPFGYEACDHQLVLNPEFLNAIWKQDDQRSHQEQQSNKDSRKLQPQDSAPKSQSQFPPSAPAPTLPRLQ